MYVLLYITIFYYYFHYVLLYIIFCLTKKYDCFQTFERRSSKVWKQPTFEKDKNSVIYKQLTLIKQSRMYFSVQQRVFRERTRTT